MRQISLLSTIVLFLMAGSAYAGYTQPAPVIVDLDNQFAQGDQLTAKVSDSDIEAIGCGIRIFDSDGNPFEFGFCQATDSTGASFVCLTQSPDLLEAMRATSAYAFITFSWDDNGECTRIGFSTQSFYLPDKKAK